MTFDPYHKWLGIPPDEQPPTHYRLLGIREFEDDHGVIDNAADRQMAHIRNFAGGPRGNLSQRILNEISTARICLLDQRQKANYDNHLKQQLQSPEPPPVPTRPDQLPAPPAEARQNADIPTPGSAIVSRGRRQRPSGRRFRPTIRVWQIAFGGIAGVCVAIVLLWVVSKKDPLGIFGNTRLAEGRESNSGVQQDRRKALAPSAANNGSDNDRQSATPDSPRSFPVSTEQVLTEKEDSAGQIDAGAKPQTASQAREPQDEALLYFSFNRDLVFSTGDHEYVRDESQARTTAEVQGARHCLGVIGDGMAFDGDNKILVSDETLPTGNRPRSVSLWFRTSDTSRRKILFSYGGLTRHDNVHLMIVEENQSRQYGAFSNKLVVGFAGAPAMWLAAEDEVTDGKWHQVSLVHEPVHGVALYLDGRKVGQSRTTYDTTLTGAAVIGSYIGPGHGFVGMIDELYVFDRALSDHEVANLASVSGQTHTVSDTKPVEIDLSKPPEDLTREWQAHSKSILAVALSADRELVASASSNGSVKVWKVCDGELINSFEGHDPHARCVKFVPGKSLIVSGGEDGVIRVSEILDGELIRVIPTGDRVLLSLAVMPSGTTVIAAGADGAVRLFDLESGELRRIWPAHAHGVFTVSLSGDGGTLVTAAEDSFVRVWDVASGRKLGEFRDDDKTVSVDISFDGNRVVNACHRISVREIPSMVKVLEVPRRGESPVTVAMSPDGLLAVAGSERETTVWDLKDGRLAHQFPGSAAWHYSVEISNDKRIVVAGGADGKLRVWDLDPEKSRDRD